MLKEYNYHDIKDSSILNKLACEAWNMPLANEDGKIEWFRVHAIFKEEDDEEICSDCGADIERLNWTYCPYCGADIEDESYVQTDFYSESAEDAYEQYTDEKDWDREKTEFMKDEIMKKATFIIQVREDLLDKFNNKKSGD